MTIFKIKNLDPFGTLFKGVTYAAAIRPYISPAKLTNLILCETEKVKRSARPRSMPYIAILDTVNACNLSCSYCPTGQKRKSGRDLKMIDPKRIQDLIDEAGRYLVIAYLFNWGEPLLHPDIAKIVEMFHRARIFTSISSNLNITNREAITDICDAGLDHLIASFSGVSQSTYEQYHHTGSLDVMVENIRHLVDYKKKTGHRNPIIELKYLTFKHNLHEVEHARKLAKKIGVNIFRAVRAGGTAEAIVEENQAQKRGIKVGLCHHLWHAVVLNADDGVAPCCYLFFKEDDFGKYHGEHLREIRRNSKFTIARKLFNPSCLNDLPDDLQHSCLKCEIVHSQKHLGEYLRMNPNAVLGHRTGGY